MKQCEWCGNEFETNVSYQIYCSSECRESATKDKIAQRYAITRRNRMLKKKRNCKSCGAFLSAYNDDTTCSNCSVNPSDVNKALRDLKGFLNDETL